MDSNLFYQNNEEIKDDTWNIFKFYATPEEATKDKEATNKQELSTHDKSILQTFNGLLLIFPTKSIILFKLWKAFLKNALHTLPHTILPTYLY